MGRVLLVSPQQASSAPHKRRPQQPTHFSTRSGSHFCLFRPWRSTSARSTQGVTDTAGLAASPDPLQRSARFPPQRVPSGGGAAGTSDGSKGGKRVKTIANVWTCHGARAWLRAPGASQPLPLVAAPALLSGAAEPEPNARVELFARVCVFLLPQGRHCAGEHCLLTGPKDGVFGTCSLKFLSIVLCWGMYRGRRYSAVWSLQFAAGIYGGLIFWLILPTCWQGFS